MHITTQGYSSPVRCQILFFFLFFPFLPFLFLEESGNSQQFRKKIRKGVRSRNSLGKLVFGGGAGAGEVRSPRWFRSREQGTAVCLGTQRSFWQSPGCRGTGAWADRQGASTGNPGALQRVSTLWVWASQLPWVPSPLSGSVRSKSSRAVPALRLQYLLPANAPAPCVKFSQPGLSLPFPAHLLSQVTHDPGHTGPIGGPCLNSLHAFSRHVHCPIHSFI